MIRFLELAGVAVASFVLTMMAIGAVHRTWYRR